MARYATNEEQHVCDVCDARSALREMTKRIKNVKDTEYHCPRCDTHLFVTNDYGLMRVIRLFENRREINA